MKAKFKIESIGIGEIMPSKTNPRKTFDNADIAELAASIKANGLQQPIIVRLVKDSKKGMHEIIDGERRFRACLSLKMNSVTAEVRDMSDEEVLEFQLMTFLHRKDITPLEEANAFHDLSKQGHDPESIAARIGKPAHHIVRTLRLLKLVPTAMKSLQKGDLPIGHAFEICRLQPKDQERVMEKVFTDAGFDSIEEGKLPISLSALKEFIRNEIHLDLRKISFSKIDAALVPKAGPCTHCVKRTGFNEGLFPDIQQSDTCTDPACFKEKVEAHIAQQKAKLKSEKVKVVEFTPEYQKPADHPNAITVRSYKEVKGKPCKFAVQGIAVDGPNRGKVTPICNNKECSQHWRNDYRRDQALMKKKEKQKTPAQIERERIAKVKEEIKQKAIEIFHQWIPAKVGEKLPSDLNRDTLNLIALALLNNGDPEDFVKNSLGISFPWDSAKRKKIISGLKPQKVKQMIHAIILYDDLDRASANEYEKIIARYGVNTKKLMAEATKEAEKEFAEKLKPQSAALPEKEEEEAEE
ncbi:MAG: ParB/RepB/Spo0J family partition protein [Bacteroidota bacterium]